MKKRMILVILLSLLILVACTQNIKEVKTKEKEGKTVTIKGTAEKVIKIGGLSGFTLVQGEDKIVVKTQDVPKDGEKVTVKGTVKKDPIFGYYLHVE